MIFARVNCSIIVRNLPENFHNFLNYYAGERDEISEKTEDLLFFACSNLEHAFFKSKSWSTLLLGDFQCKYEKYIFKYIKLKENYYLLEFSAKSKCIFQEAEKFFDFISSYTNNIYLGSKQYEGNTLKTRYYNEMKYPELKKLVNAELEEVENLNTSKNENLEVIY